MFMEGDMPNTHQNPQHVAIIMDGNGRWGQTRFGKRSKGHIKGAQNVKKIVECAGRINISTLTLWGYSTDNAKRPANEVNILMWLFQRYIATEATELHGQDVRVTFIGQRSGLPDRLQRLMCDLELKTKNNRGLHLQIALNYGGRDEIARACKKLVDAGEEISVENISRNLDTALTSDPDMVIRTSGESRTSGFMPWQTVHSEWFFPDTLWPDFTVEEFLSILDDFSKRERRLGGVVAAK